MGVSTRDRAASWKERASVPIRLAWRHPWGSAVAGGLLMLAGLWVWWATQLWGLPDVGDPFDIAAFEAVSVPAEHNAFFEYREAASMCMRTWRKVRAKMTAKELLKVPDNWAEANPHWRDFLGQSGEGAIPKSGDEERLAG
jgi:hypothetical protein